MRHRLSDRAHSFDQRTEPPLQGDFAQKRPVQPNPSLTPKDEKA
jgi:hypothetical protein